MSRPTSSATNARSLGAPAARPRTPLSVTEEQLETLMRCRREQPSATSASSSSETCSRALDAGDLCVCASEYAFGSWQHAAGFLGRRGYRFGGVAAGAAENAAS